MRGKDHRHQESESDNREAAPEGRVDRQVDGQSEEAARMIRLPGPRRAPEEFEEFYRSRAGRLFKYASVVAGAGSPAEAEDACQEAWLKMWRAWDRADPARRDAWALSVVRNCCIDTMRREQRRKAVVSAQPIDGEAPYTSSPDDGPEDAVDRSADADVIARALETLPEHLRQTLWLREVADLSYAEIAAALDVPIGTVMSRLHSARRRLARQLERQVTR